MPTSLSYKSHSTTGGRLAPPLPPPELLTPPEPARAECGLLDVMMASEWHRHDISNITNFTNSTHPPHIVVFINFIFFFNGFEPVTSASSPSSGSSPALGWIRVLVRLGVRVLVRLGVRALVRLGSVSLASIPG